MSRTTQNQIPKVKDGKRKEPCIFIGIPTGPRKLYSTYYMIAALANLDYKNFEIHWACTGGEDNSLFHEFRERLTSLMQAVKWSEEVSWTIHYVVLSKEERNQNYMPILKNKAVLRDAFLDGDCEYFLLLGGDNPPPRDAIKRLFKTDADVSIGVCYQRPEIDPQGGVYPLVWRYMWMPNDLDKFNDLDPRNLEELRLAWLHCPTMINVMYDPKWKDKRNIYQITGGDGCALIRRRVLEMIDWSVTPEKGYHSEDVHFMSLTLWHGFTTGLATDLHVPHLDPNGKAY